MKHLKVKQSAAETLSVADLNKICAYVAGNEFDSTSSMEGTIRVPYAFREDVAPLSRFPGLVIDAEEGLFAREYVDNSSNAPLVKALLNNGAHTDSFDSDLPSGYVKQTYIGCLHRSTVLSDSNLNNHFVTPLNGTANDIIRTRFILKVVEGADGNLSVYGNTGGGSLSGISLYANVSDGYFYMANGWGNMKLCQFQYDTEYEIEHSYTYIIINGTRYNNSSERTEVARGYYLLTKFNTSTVPGPLIKYFSIERDGAIVSNLVACKNMSTGMNQFYDTVRDAALRPYYTSNNRELAIDTLGPDSEGVSYTEYDVKHADIDFIDKSDPDLVTFQSRTYNVLDAMVLVGKLDLEGCANLQGNLDITEMRSLTEINLTGTQVSGITIRKATPPSFASIVIPETTTIRVPAAAVNDYKAAWPTYASQIVSI